MSNVVVKDSENSECNIGLLGVGDFFKIGPNSYILIDKKIRPKKETLITALELSEKELETFTPTHLVVYIPTVIISFSF